MGNYAQNQKHAPSGLNLSNLQAESVSLREGLGVTSLQSLTRKKYPSGQHFLRFRDKGRTKHTWNHVSQGMMSSPSTEVMKSRLQILDPAFS